MGCRKDATPLEIEQKFIIPADIDIRLNAINAVPVKEVSYVDVYVDTKDNVLALSDVWLRRRNGKYQLKYPPEDKVESDVLQYRETDDVHLIQDIVDEKIRSGSVTSRISDLNELTPFVQITTHRKSYRVGENISIDLDETDMGHNIGEVEVISSTSTTVHKSIDEVKKVIIDLGVETVGSAGGKVVHYLSVYNQPLLDRIRSRLAF